MHKESILLRVYFLLIILIIVASGLEIPNASTALPPKQEVQKMTLADAVTLALRHNRTIESACLDRLLERFDLKTAHNKFYPDISFSSSASQSRTEGESAHYTEIGGEVVLKVPTGGEFSLTWSQPVHSSQTEQWFN